jgi:hypothetical protein
MQQETRTGRVAQRQKAKGRETSQDRPWLAETLLSASRELTVSLSVILERGFQSLAGLGFLDGGSAPRGLELTVDDCSA